MTRPQHGPYSLAAHKRSRKPGHVVLLIDADGKHVMTEATRRSLHAVIDGLRLLCEQPRLQLFSGADLDAFKEEGRASTRPGVPQLG